MILIDYQGRQIRLTQERLKHILKHPEMVTMEEEIKTTLQYPEEVRRSKTDASVVLSYRYHEKTEVGNKWLCVVTKYLNDDAFVITAYLTHRIKPGELIWQQK